MKKTMLLTLAAMIFTLNAKAEIQAPRYQISAPVRKAMVARNSLSVELLGRGLIYSVNYDRLVSPNAALGLGVGHLSAGNGSTSSRASLTMVPLYANYYIGSSFRHRFLLTGGATLAFVSVSSSTSSYKTASGTTYAGTSFTDSGTLILPNVGAGYEFRGGGFLFRLSTYVFAGSGAILPWLGLSVGANF